MFSSLPLRPLGELNAFDGVFADVTSLLRYFALVIWNRVKHLQGKLLQTGVCLHMSVHTCAG